MKDQSVIHNTFVIERSYATSPERVFEAFSDPARKRRWYTAGEHHEVEKFDADFRVGGSERTAYRFLAGTPFPGVLMTNDTSYEDIVSDSRIVMASTMAIGGKRVSVSLITFEFLRTETGTDMIFTHQGVFFEGSGGPEMREGGWKKLFEKLAGEIG